jgi:hypothetical protein
MMFAAMLSGWGASALLAAIVVHLWRSRSSAEAGVLEAHRVIEKLRSDLVASRRALDESHAALHGMLHAADIEGQWAVERQSQANADHAAARTAAGPKSDDPEASAARRAAHEDLLRGPQLAPPAPPLGGAK